LLVLGMTIPSAEKPAAKLVERVQGADTDAVWASSVRSASAVRDPVVVRGLSELGSKPPQGYSRPCRVTRAGFLTLAVSQGLNIGL
jgi:hypothetical protein